jgi:L-threonylcarbamoyladenylate synthase
MLHKSERKLNLSDLDQNIIDETARMIKNGGVILYPTDTIYGLGCNAFNLQAVERIYTIKKRSSNQPMLALIHSVQELDTLVEELSLNAQKLIKTFWPGPVTFVFRANSNVPRFIQSEDGKVGIRLPNHEFCRKICELSGVPILSTSANVSGVQQTGNIRVLSDIFSHQVDLFIDAGDCTSITVSTIVDVSGSSPIFLRDGMISREEIQAALS